MLGKVTDGRSIYIPENEDAHAYEIETQCRLFVFEALHTARKYKPAFTKNPALKNTLMVCLRALE